MSKYNWPASMLEKYKLPADVMTFFDSFSKESFDTSERLDTLFAEHEALKSTSAKQDRYITELEKQITLLQKTLDLIDRNGGGEDG